MRTVLLFVVMFGIVGGGLGSAFGGRGVSTGLILGAIVGLVIGYIQEARAEHKAILAKVEACKPPHKAFKARECEEDEIS